MDSPSWDPGPGPDGEGDARRWRRVRPPRGLARCATVRCMSLADRTAVVTGATKGVGRGVALELARHGARVFVTGRSSPADMPAHERITAIRCDHRVDAEVDAAFASILEGAGG